jgi:hypothetical protein
VKRFAIANARPVGGEMRVDRREIYAYMAGTLKNLDCHPLKIGGVEDHVHVLSSLSKNIALSDLIGRLKVARY